ncbi:MAG TPA: PLP-dependent aminotransferase family protein [Steroidobacteraceae bacterium]
MKTAILRGALIPGSRLPSTRSLAAALGVSRKSVIEAFELLATEGLILPRVGVGSVVCQTGALPKPRQLPARAPAPSRYSARLRELPPLSLSGSTQGPRYSFQYGAPLVNPSIFLSWTRKISAAARRAGPGYGPAVGHPPLRAAIANYLSRRRGLICEPDDVLIVSGTQQAISLSARVLLNEGDAVVMEDPFYELASNAFEAHGAARHYVPVDSEGLCVHEMPETDARLAFVTPSHQFPSGVVMTLSRRMELLGWAGKKDAWIFEDDYDSEFHDGERPVSTLRSLDLSGRVIYVGTFSKTLFPSLRLGYMLCPAALRADFLRAKLLDDLGSPVLEQAALTSFLQSGLYEKQLRRSVKEVLLRRRVLVEELKNRLGDWVEIGPHGGGMHLVVWFPRLTSQRVNQLISRAAQAGVGVQRVDPFYRAPPAAPGLLLGYAALSAGQIRTAIGILAECIKRL